MRGFSSIESDEQKLLINVKLPTFVSCQYQMQSCSNFFGKHHHKSDCFARTPPG